MQPWPGGSMVSLMIQQIWDDKRRRVGKVFCNSPLQKALHKHKYQQFVYYMKIQQILVIRVWARAWRWHRCNTCRRDLTIPNIFSVKSCRKCWTLRFNYHGLMGAGGSPRQNHGTSHHPSQEQGRWVYWETQTWPSCISLGRSWSWARMWACRWGSGFGLR